jgi:hypothetical protein
VPPPTSYLPPKLTLSKNSEQETLISTLTTLNTTRNATFLRALYILPTLATLPFLLRLFLPNPKSSPSVPLLLPLLGLSSLAATTWLLHTLKTTETGFAVLDQPSNTAQSKAKQQRDVLMAGGGGKSPLEQHLPVLNVGLAVLALLMGVLEQLKEGGGRGGGVSPVLLGGLPGVVYAVMVGAKVVMGGVDPEKELSGLRYGYKGA